MGCLERHGKGIGNSETRVRFTLLITVSPSVNIFEPLTYGYHGNPDDIQPGSRVIVPLGNRVVTGWIMESRPETLYRGKVKNVIGIIADHYVPDTSFMDFCRSAAELYFVSPAILLDYALSPKRKPLKAIYFEKDGETVGLHRFSLPELQAWSKKTPIQFFYKHLRSLNDNTISAVQDHKIGGDAENKKGTKSRENSFILSYRREEDYRQVISTFIDEGKAVLIAVPDNATAAYVKQAIPGVEVYNSSLKTSRRETLWADFLKGKAGAVVGGLSALLLPIGNLGLVICERAGSPLFKNTTYSEFNIHTLARLRAETFQIPLIEGYSTLSVRAAANKEAYRIEDRRQDRQIELEVHMLKRGELQVPDSLIELIKAYFLENKKILILLNRKASFQYLFCPKCQQIQKCHHCRGVLKVEEEQEGENHCRKCKSELVFVQDISMASVKERVERQVSEKGIYTLSAENFDQPSSVAEKIEKSKIVISTPVILNPYFRELFDAVIYLRPESMFNINHYDAAEMVFANVSELRELVKVGGYIDIFSTFHFHYAMRLLGDEAAFFDRELKYRQWFRLPPYFNVYHLEVRHKDLRKMAAHMRKIYRQFKEEFHIQPPYLISRSKIHGYYRGKMEFHAQPSVLHRSGLLQQRNLKVSLFAV